jgi:hypothetical protein
MIGVWEAEFGSGRIVGNPYLGIISGFPVIQSLNLLGGASASATRDSKYHPVPAVPAN